MGDGQKNVRTFTEKRIFFRGFSPVTSRWQWWRLSKLMCRFPHKSFGDLVPARFAKPRNQSDSGPLNA
jgi:hypothetical protein